MRNPKAFTLIELLVVIAIIALLSSIVLASLNSARAKSRDARRKSDIAQIVNAFYLYAQDNNGNFPVVGGARCIGVPDGQTCWGDRNMSGSTALMSAMSPYMSNLPSVADPLPSRGWGDRYLYLDTRTYLNACGGTLVDGKYVLWRPDNTSAPASLNCQGKGVRSCCGTGGPCGNDGGHYCAYRFDE